MENVHLNRRVDSVRRDVENIIDSLIEEIEGKESEIEQLKSIIETLEEEIQEWIEKA